MDELNEFEPSASEASQAIQDSSEFTNALKGEDPSDEEDIAPTGKEEASKGRCTTFSPDELLLVSRAYMMTSEDAACGTSQKVNVFWETACLKYNALVAQANALHKEVPDYVPIISRTPESLRGVWKRRIQRVVAKFAGIVLTNPPPSGFKRDDAQMELYYKNMMKLYFERSANWKGLPHQFNPFMKWYLFLGEHPKFETEFPVDKSPPSMRKTTKSLQAPTHLKRPQGRDAATQWILLSTECRRPSPSPSPRLVHKILPIIGK
jgi:hypothetical protein